MIKFHKVTILFALMVLIIPIMISVSPVAHSMGEDILIWANNIGRKPDDPPFLTMNYRIRKMYFAATSFKAKQPVVFFGDSITFGADWQELFPDINVVNRGISGDTTLGLLNRLDEVVELRPRQIFLMIGTNDLCFGRPQEKILENYQLIIDRMRRGLPETPIYIQSVLPLNDKMFPTRGLRNNKNISALNIELKKLAERNGLPYIDIAEKMTGADGRLAPEYTYDGLHLSEYAYQVWKNQIKQFVGKVGASQVGGMSVRK